MKHLTLCLLLPCLLCFKCKAQDTLPISINIGIYHPDTSGLYLWWGSGDTILTVGTTQIPIHDPILFDKLYRAIELLYTADKYRKE